MREWIVTQTTELPKEWASLVAEFPLMRSDVYYAPAYAASWLDWEGGTAVCLQECYDGVQYLYSFLLRELPWQFDDHWRYDVQSFYGYGGIISSEPPQPHHLVRLNNAIDQWMVEHGVVAEFIRQHPLLHPQPQWARRAEMAMVRTNVYALPPDHALEQLDSATRRNIRRALREGLRIEWVDAARGAEPFAQLYRLTAQRLKMEPFYHFPLSYFLRCAELLRENVFYLIAVAGDEPVAAMMVLRWSSILTYHLGASDERFWHMRPNDLLFSQLLKYAVEHDIGCVSFGGGTSADHNDSLYRYKSKFGQCHMPVYIGKRVHHRELYERLCVQWESLYPELAPSYQNYFLRYRVRPVTQESGMSV